ncbi:UDP:flavonoid glycosyltransferase YjiC, YdhE family [Palleronia salina]|uniref:UDP:flavonoid glycosyltransferase YjiC, YdhE family n=1 Tax=Palleronia salina TaxID=313368 RepID=A0A1M6BJR1_9RHOB|nr:nucleotide disphospho-sugar-binding domain-containing protein [Palleronia salina]SHI48962.1 UDP:flavonoid glycosyltransferase YjiC, YdhE family [Palleronia salina]
MTAPILLSTVGSLGDLFPALALARALRARGQPVRLLLGPDDRDTAAGLGIEATTFGPDSATVAARLGMDRDAIARQVFRDPSPILRRATYPMLADLAREMQPHVRGCRAVGWTALAMAAPLAAELEGVPHVPILLQPMLMRSALAPPRLRGFVPPMIPRPGGRLAVGWNRIWLGIVDLEMRRRHGRAQARVRKELGLPPTNAVPFFGHALEPALRLGLWDPVLGTPPKDAAAVEVTGFSALPDDGALPVGLREFLDAGPPPFVVTLGSVSHRLAGRDFWDRAVRLGRAAGMRIVLLSGPVDAPQGDDILALSFAPHAPLFARAGVVLHHGGMGTLGRALHAGVPQLILPLGADQPDNAARAERLGVARRLRGQVDGPKAVEDLKAMCQRADVAQAVAARLIPDGAARAADLMMSRF